MIYDIPTLTSEAIGLLKSLIAIPSLSRDEEKAADYLQNYIEMQGMATGRKGNNVWSPQPDVRLKETDLAAEFPYRHRKTRQRVAERSFQTNAGK